MDDHSGAQVEDPDGCSGVSTIKGETMKQIILLHPGLPEPLMELFSAHLVRTDAQIFLVAEAVVQNGAFLELDILPAQHSEDASMSWRVQIPIHVVLAIAQFRPDAKRPLGFVT